MGYSTEAIEAFDEFAREATRRHVMRTSVLFSLVFSAAFVVGQLSLGDVPAARLERIWLPTLAMACGICGALMRWVPPAQRHPIAVASVTYAMVACVGAAQLGVMGGLDGPFFYGIYTLPPLVMVLPCSLGRRIWITAALLIPFVLAYFLPHQEYLDHPFLHIPAIYLVAITVVSVLLGDWIYGLTRDRFLFALRIDEQRELLARHNASLAEEVEIKASAVERLSGELETVRIDERSDLARALHDDLGQLIAGARMELGNIERALSGEADAGDKDLSFLYEIIESLAHSTRHIVGALRAEGPGHAEGLEESIESLVSPLRERAALEITTAVFLDEVPPPATREAIYRTVQEAMTNILKHANASRADIQVHARGANEVVVVVSDDGGGFDTNGELGGWGLRGIRERLGSLEGTLEIRSDETGTRLEARMPIDR